MKQLSITPRWVKENCTLLASNELCSQDADSKFNQIYRTIDPELVGPFIQVYDGGDTFIHICGSHIIINECMIQNIYKMPDIYAYELKNKQKQNNSL